MFIVEVLDANGKWKKDREYKLFDNAEKRLYIHYEEGTNARIVEVKGK